jgi:hypothetical protein
VIKQGGSYLEIAVAFRVCFIRLEYGTPAMIGQTASPNGFKVSLFSLPVSGNSFSNSIIQVV